MVKVTPASATRLAMRHSILAQVHGVVLDSVLLSGGVAALMLLAMGGSELEVGLIFMLMNGAIMGRVLAAPRLDTERLKRIVCRWQAISSIAAGLVLVVYLLAMHWQPAVGRWCMVGILGVYFFARQTGQAAWPPLMSQIIPQPLRGRFFGRMRSYLRLSGFATILIAGLLLGQDPTPWRFAAVLGLGLVVYSVRQLWVNRLPDPDPPREGDPEPFFRVLLRPLSDQPYRRFVIISFMARVLPVLTIPFFMPFLVTELGVPSMYAVYATGAGMLGAMVTLNMWGRMTDRWGSRSTYTLSLISLTASGVVYAIAPTYEAWPLASIACVAAGFMLHGSATAGIGIAETVRMMRQTPDQFRGSYMTLVFMAHGLAGAAAAFAGGVILSQLPAEMVLLEQVVYSKRVYFMIAAVISLGAIGMFALLPQVGEPQPRYRLEPLVELASLSLVPPVGYIRTLLRRKV